jgi:hypothetical protein
MPLSLLGNNSVKTFPRQQRNVGGVVFYAVSVISNKRRRLVLPTTSCFIEKISKLPQKLLLTFVQVVHILVMFLNGNFARSILSLFCLNFSVQNRLCHEIIQRGIGKDSCSPPNVLHVLPIYTSLNCFPKYAHEEEKLPISMVELNFRSFSQKGIQDFKIQVKHNGPFSLNIRGISC